MSAEFSNTYQEILLDNLMAIIKQNFVFQTQLKMSENIGKQKEEIEIKYNELLSKYSSMEGDLKLLEQYKSKANSNDSNVQEKQRIQSALNDEMRKCSGLRKNLEIKNTEILKMQEYIEKLESIAPVSKLKKINSEKIIQSPKVKVIEEPAPSDLLSIKADGSSF